MSIYAITFYLKEETHSCGCEDHNHEHHHHHEHEHIHRDDYEVTAHIKELGAWAHILPTTFLLKTDLNAEEISTKIKAYLEVNDMLFVTKVNKEDVASLTPGVVEWIQS